jgi:hypothetical protein
MVMLTAMLHFLHHRYHRPCHVISSDAFNSAVLEGNPDVAKFWSVGRYIPFPLRFEWPRLARALRESHPGPIYVCEHHHRQLPRMRRMLAFSGVDPARCVFIAEKPGTVHHSVDRLIHFAKQTPAALRASDNKRRVGAETARARFRPCRVGWVAAQRGLGRAAAHPGAAGQPPQHEQETPPVGTTQD